MAWSNTNTNSNIDHDCELGNYAYCAGVSLAGNVVVDDNVLIGVGSCKTRSKIGVGSLIGAGSVVVEDVKEGTTVKGNPARWIDLVSDKGVNVCLWIYFSLGQITLKKSQRRGKFSYQIK